MEEKTYNGMVFEDEDDALSCINSLMMMFDIEKDEID